jgi:hypothetical protein
MCRFVSDFARSLSRAGFRKSRSCASRENHGLAHALPIQPAVTRAYILIALLTAALATSRIAMAAP